MTGLRGGWRLAEGLLQSIDLQQWDHAAEAEADPRPRLLHTALNCSTAAAPGRCLRSSLHAVTSVSPLQHLQE